MKALEIRRNVAKLGLARITAAVSPSAAVRVGPLEYRHVDEPDLPGPGWQRVNTRLSGICGSDLSLIEGHASTYFDDWVSFPFVPGHEIVGSLDDGTRVIIEPVLGHEARGFAPPFDGAAPGDGDDYAHLATGDLEPGIQTGFCCSTGGGWAPSFVAHESQLHRIGDDMPDERAVLVEPIAGGIHAALLTWPTVAEVTAPVVAVLGAGTMGLAAIAGLRRYVPDVRIVVGARYPIQQRHRDVRRRRHRRRTRTSWAAPCGGWSAATSSAITSRAVLTPRSTRSARGVDHRLPAHHPAARPRRADGDAGRGDARSHRALAPRDRDQGRLHVRHRDAAGRVADAHVRPRRRHRQRAARPSACCRPRTGSPTTSTRSPTPRRPAAAAPSRSPSICERRAEHASPRIRPRGRPFDPTDPVLARREVQPREAAGRPQPGDLSARAAGARSTTSTARSVGRCSSRTTPIPCRRCCSPA